MRILKSWWFYLSILIVITMEVNTKLILPEKYGVESQLNFSIIQIFVNWLVIFGWLTLLNIFLKNVRVKYWITLIYMIILSVITLPQLIMHLIS